MNFTGNDLKALRNGLSLNEEAFAKHLGLKVKLYQKAEKFRDKVIPIDDEEFHSLFNKLCYAAPQMIIIRFEHMQKIQQVLQIIAQKLEKVDKWLRSVERRQEKKRDNEEEVEKEGNDKEDEKHILLRSGGLDKRSAFPTEDND